MQAYRLAALSHAYPADFCQDGSAFIAAIVAAGLRDGSGIRGACAERLRQPDSASGEVMRASITAAIGQPGKPVTTASSGRYHASGQQRVACDARETVPAALRRVPRCDGTKGTT
jgi:hypothetical protein